MPVKIVSMQGVGDSGMGETIAEPSKSDKPKFPYGLKLSFDKNVLEKLGLTVSSFKVGDLVNIEGKGEVTGIREDEYSTSIDIQVTDIGIENPADFDAGFEDALKEDTRIYSIPEAETQGGFKKAIWNATR